ncbi:MAG: 5'/3'-nucleotidase SurE [Ignavibacteria bacterium]|nr:5'/3'-nucleotidase SurE [Ignavibacteria bacterium]
MLEKPLIFVTNDDGIDSNGLYQLVKELRTIGEVIVVAPDHQQSAVGHMLTISKPLRFSKFFRNGEIFGFAVNGSPSDCVKLALSSILPRKPDILVSGINYGKNTSINILYSGTVAAATEGYLAGIPSIAISLSTYDINYDCKFPAILSRKIIQNLFFETKLKFKLLNVNIPAIPETQLKGIMITHCSNSYWNDKYEKRVDPFGREYYWFAGEYVSNSDDEGSDDWALKNGFVSITPISFNFTDFSLLNELKKIELKM